MRVWIDLANSPHVAVFRPLVGAARERGWDVVLTARDHAQTLALARATWPDVLVVGGESPPGRVAKAASVAERARALYAFARRTRPQVALSHASYAQVVAARAARVPAVTMMDYEHQPANHLSFRLASRLLVPEVFPEEALRRFGAWTSRVVRYPGYKEELYLADAPPPLDPSELGVDASAVLAVFRPPPEGALYHRGANARFDEILRAGVERSAAIVLLPRTHAQRERYAALAGVVVPPPLDGLALLRAADVVVGAGGTMNRESALLGTPTYSVFAGRLAAVDAALMREGRLRDARTGGLPPFEKKPAATAEPLGARAGAIRERVLAAVEELAR